MSCKDKCLGWCCWGNGYKHSLVGCRWDFACLPLNWWLERVRNGPSSVGSWGGWVTVHFSRALFTVLGTAYPDSCCSSALLNLFHTH